MVYRQKRYTELWRGRKNLATFAIFVALPEELDAVASVLEAQATMITPLTKLGAGQTRFLLELKDRNGKAHNGIVFLIRGMGNVKAAAFVGSVFAVDEPPLHAVLVGISGSLNAETAKIGDVVLSAHVKFYSPDKIRSLSSDYLILTDQQVEEICNTSNPLSISELRAPGQLVVDGRDVVHISSFYRYLRDKKFDSQSDNLVNQYLHKNKSKIETELQSTGLSTVTVMSGAILGSNMVIDSGDFVSYLSNKNKYDSTDYYKLNTPDEFIARSNWDNSELIAVDMESYGFFSALESFRSEASAVNGVAVRGISDLAAGKTESDVLSKGETRKIAAANAMIVAIDYLKEHLSSNKLKHDLR